MCNLVLKTTLKKALNLVVDQLQTPLGFELYCMFSLKGQTRTY